MINTAKVQRAALIVLNDDYAGTDYAKLDGVKDDGDKMEKMLSTYGFQVEIKRNVEDIGKEVQMFFNKYEKAETFHFHFSGHGVENAIVKFDPKVSTKDKNGKKFETSEPFGDCMVGSKGKLYSAHDLRHDLLGFHPGKAVATLDCCRDSNKRGACQPAFVTLSHRRELNVENQKRIAVLQGTAELHTANDINSFTKELYKVYVKEDKAIPILEIERKVNMSWDDKGITQICKLDIIRDGKSWKDYMWPASRDAITKTGWINFVYSLFFKENTSTDQNDIKYNEETRTTTIIATLKELNEEMAEMKERINKLEVKIEEVQDEKKKLKDENDFPSENDKAIQKEASSTTSARTSDVLTQMEVSSSEAVSGPSKLTTTRLTVSSSASLEPLLSPSKSNVPIENLEEKKLLLRSESRALLKGTFKELEEKNQL